MPPLIAGVTLCVRKWGEGFGGWIGGFPWVAGPISFFLALENSPAFVAASTPAALMGSIGTTFFALIYAIAAPRMSWLPAVLISYASFFVVALASLGHTPSLPVAFAVNVIVLTGVLYIFPKPKDKPEYKQHPVYDIPLRMVVATTFVVLLTQLSDKLGPTWSGILTPFPIMTSTLAVFTHVQQGPQATARILYGLLSASYGFVCFVIGVWWLVPILPIGIAYSILAIGTMAVNGIAIRLIKKQNQP